MSGPLRGNYAPLEWGGIDRLSSLLEIIRNCFERGYVSVRIEKRIGDFCFKKLKIFSYIYIEFLNIIVSRLFSGCTSHSVMEK